MEGSDDDSVIKTGRKIIDRINSNILITRGKDGMTLIEKNKHYHIQTKAKEVYDVSGAGDTVIATLSLCIAAGMDLYQASDIANHAAGIVVGKVGTSTTNIEELKNSLKNENKES